MGKTIQQLLATSAEQKEIIHSYSETLAIMCTECFTTHWDALTTVFPTNVNEAKEGQSTYGQIELCNEIILWAQEFEQINLGREWDGEFYDEIDSFINSKLS